MTSESAHRAIGVAVLGLGNVGSEVVRIIREQAEELEARVGAPLELRGVAVRRIGSDRGIPEELQTTDAESLVGRDDVDIVVEVIGGIELPRKLILSSLNSGKSVVTANKALLADHTGELAEAAEANSVDLYFEAAVAGAIPVIRPLTQSLAGDRVNKVAGIVNGTTNFILSAMDETGADYEETLAEAGRLGYAEADPTADVEGYDAAAKAAILASIAFHTRVTAADVYREGSPRSPPPTWRRRRHSTAPSSCSRSASASSRPRARSGFPLACTRRWFRSATRSLRSTAHSTPSSWKQRTPAGSCSTARAQAAPHRVRGHG
ncbi:hypothetical protein GCM10020255_093370 [Rhodococcus baikonurensis]